MLKDVPVGRRISDTLYLAPGVSSSGTAGRPTRRSPAAAASTTSTSIDGVNVTNQGYGALGSYSIIFGSLGNATPFDFIKEVQVKTGGYEAEFGQSTGGVVNVITKSGTQRSCADRCSATRGRTALESDWKQFQSPNGTVQTHRHAAPATAASRAAARSSRTALFFFGAIDPVAREDAPPRAARASRSSSLRRRRPDRDDSVTYSAKATWQVNQRQHRIDASFFGDPSNGDNGPQRGSALLDQTTRRRSARSTYGGHNQTVRYDGVLSSDWLVEATSARALNQHRRDCRRSTRGASTDQHRDAERSSPAASASTKPGNRSLNNQCAIKATNIVGGHQISVRRSSTTTSNYSQHQPAHRADVHSRRTAGRRRPARRSRSFPMSTFGQIYRVTARQLQQRPRRRRRAITTLLRAGHLEGRQPPDDQPGPPLRAGER